MKVVYFLPNTRNPFWREVISGASRRASSEGMAVEAVSSDLDGAKQLAQLQAWESYGPNAVFVSPIDTKGASSICGALLGAKVPVVSIDLNLTPNVTASIISGNMQGGRLAASYLADRAGAGSSVVHVRAQEDLHNVQLRSSAFIAEATRRGLEIVATLQADGSRELANSGMAELLKNGVRFQAVFAESDHMAIGVIDAIEAAGASSCPLIVGYDGTIEAKGFIRSKKMDATVAQDPASMGEKAVEVLVDVMKGRPVRSVVTILPHLLTAADLA